MTKTFVLDDDTLIDSQIVSDQVHGGKSLVSHTKDDDSYILHCTIEKSYRWPFCEVSFQIAQDKGIDFSEFSHIELSILSFGEGPQKVRFYLRHADDAYTDKAKMETYKINEIQFDTNKHQAPLKIPLNTFVVPSWWLHERSLSPFDAATELSNVYYIEVSTGDFREAGKHTIYIDDIRLHGKWISKELLLMLILVLWIAFGFAFLGQSYYQTTLEAKKQRKLKDELEKINQALEIEKQELADISTKDSLTDVYNRHGLSQYLPALSRGVKELGESTSVVFLDIDHFKSVNDENGHDVGDLVLQGFANLIKANKRDTDILVRWGGEEFVLFCPVTTEADGVLFAEKLRQIIANGVWPENLMLTSSFGVAQMQPHEEIADLLKHADEALYTAKRTGRNKVIAYSKVVNKQAS
ncbi:CIA30 family protein [Catenovulum sp. SM1970]|uniref:GGDEF domain-containing protein n=1 Tax=Marinifaba aquimaris TaxID=2741323 RepID=UPI001574EAF0|nr:GGDEF domain-containing protein [Marinifaba aquimaris]NTS77783.1 CIA30 family protein [Marinifaba aquimaris]